MRFLSQIWPFKKSKIKVGDMAPGFALKNSDGTELSLSSYKGKKAVVLYFYPKDNTPFCVAESVMFRKRYEEFEKAGAEIIGISSDSPESHQKFAEKHKLPYPLLSDSQNEVRENYGVPAPLKIVPGRTTYIIDKDGKVQHEFTSQFDVNSHVLLAMKSLKEISSPKIS